MTRESSTPAADREPEAGRSRSVRSTIRSVGSGLLVFVAAIAPGLISSGSPLALLRVPLEAVLVLVVLAVLPWPVVRRVVAGLSALVFVTASVVAGLDRGFSATIGQPFNVVTGWPQLASAYGVLRDSTGAIAATAIVVLLVVAIGTLVVVLARSLLRLAALARLHARASQIGASAVAAGWIALALVGVQIVPGEPVAAADTVRVGVTKAEELTSAAAEQAAFDHAVATDAFAGVPASDLLGALKGKDVIIAFIESYGQVAVQDTPFSKRVDEVLLRGSDELTAQGYSERSAFLTSSTFGGVSWLAHSSLETGLWIDSQPKYDQVTAGNRLSLSAAFAKAGWHTVSDVPSNDQPWSIGTSFYHFDTDLNSQNVGYQGPSFSYARIPDQYTWAYFHEHELAQPHPPLMAEIDFVSSHTPWTPLPHAVPWDAIGDGSIFNPQPAQGLPPSVVWQNPEHVQKLYGQSIEYSMGTLFSFLTTYPDPNLVLVVLGDHQPATEVSGAGANHNVPISVISADPAVIDRISSWGWEPGMLPSPSAPLWRMDQFRDRFLTAFRK